MVWLQATDLQACRARSSCILNQAGIPTKEEQDHHARTHLLHTFRGFAGHIFSLDFLGSISLMERKDLMLQKNQVFTLLLMSIMTLTCFGTAIWRTKKNSPQMPSPTVLSVSPDVAIGTQPHLRGDSSAPYILVEFADYQCPPCGATNKALTQTLEKHKGKLSLAYRNYPLPFHPSAKEAAIAAERAALHGKFWQMHDALFEHQKELDSQKIGTLLNQVAIAGKGPKTEGSEIADKRVQADLKDAVTLGVEGTPTFILCCPDKRVVRLNSLTQLESYLQ
jgi:protein-disulfide isomerase